ncbi:hypothetical protein M885DRAFT_548885 [Pelagophyceae sp. CCMP2097]|nr:hypothetical protein M885DRAFT_548885 [Pelagophyceae sp. CCMP2097]|mmetsp:Transcript_13821/g.48108  ORF Transcript_13821/g.48108 Transcript_13821/m.48108 type:complete len:492 (+) Transcript_13821:58-1533(+)
MSARQVVDELFGDDDASSSSEGAAQGPAAATAASVVDELFGSDDASDGEAEPAAHAAVVGAVVAEVFGGWGAAEQPAPRWAFCGAAPSGGAELRCAFARAGLVEAEAGLVDVLIVGGAADDAALAGADLRVVRGGLLVTLGADVAPQSGWVRLSRGVLKRRNVSCDASGDAARPPPNAAELDRADACAVSPRAAWIAKRRGGVLGPHDQAVVRRAATVLRDRGVVFLAGVVDPAAADTAADCALQDFEACRVALKRRRVDLLDPLASQCDPQSYRELAMREDFRCDIRGTPLLSNAESLGARQALRGDALLAAVARNATRPEREPPKALAEGNYGRWNFEDTGPCTPTPPLHVGALGAVISLPGAAEQALHADAPHLFEHVDGLPGHYINAFFGSSAAADSRAGHTAFVPGSQVLSRCAVLVADGGRAARIDGALVRPRLGAGDALLFDARLLHFGLSNRSAGCRRPLLYCNYTEAWFRDAKNWDDNEALL